jgi:hypothetical protein
MAQLVTLAHDTVSWQKSIMVSYRRLSKTWVKHEPTMFIIGQWVELKNTKKKPERRHKQGKILAIVMLQRHLINMRDQHAASSSRLLAPAAAHGSARPVFPSDRVVGVRSPPLSLVASSACSTVGALREHLGSGDPRVPGSSFALVICRIQSGIGLHLR